ncbi:hypothetical protein ACHAXR_001016, partial [Thalassiosira sp. AJA248-18]
STMVLIPRSGSSSLIASASHTSITPCPSYRRPFNPNPSLRGIFAGSGSASMSTPYMAQAVVDLTKRSPQDVSLLYIGTASYDIAKFRNKQTNLFSKMGVTVESLNVANQFVEKDDMEEAVDKADIILVSGGNTLYAIDRWSYLGLDELLKGAAHRGKVMAGGSAGAICWFDGGHSDSDDPDTYRLAMLKNFESNADPSSELIQGEEDVVDESINSGDSKDWEYIRVEGLGIWPGLVCPHYDRIQSNGVPRMTDFDSMMKRHPYELGIGIDHHAALEVDGDDFRILAIPGETGSVKLEDSEDNVPGAWIKYVDEEGTVHSKSCPRNGKVTDLLQMVEDPQKHLLLDQQKVELCRKENPLLKD